MSSNNDSDKKVGLVIMRIPILILAALAVMLVIGLLVF
jgi:hypothetical protein